MENCEIPQSPLLVLGLCRPQADLLDVAHPRLPTLRSGLSKDLGVKGMDSGPLKVESPNWSGGKVTILSEERGPVNSQW